MPFALASRRVSIADGGTFAVSGSDAPVDATPRVALPPQDAAPAGAVAILGNGRFATNAAGSFSLCAGVLPEGRRGVLKVVELVVNLPTINTHLTGTVLVNGSPVDGLNAFDLYGREGAASLARVLDALRVELPDGASWELRATNVDGGNYTVEGIVIGWHYARELV